MKKKILIVFILSLLSMLAPGFLVVLSVFIFAGSRFPFAKNFWCIFVFIIGISFFTRGVVRILIGRYIKKQLILNECEFKKAKYYPEYNIKLITIGILLIGLSFIMTVLGM